MQAEGASRGAPHLLACKMARPAMWPVVTHVHLSKEKDESVVNLRLQTGIETALLRKQYPDREVSSPRMSNCHCTAATSDLKLACVGLFCALISTRAMRRQQGSGSAPLQPGPLHQSISKNKSCKGFHQHAQQMPWGHHPAVSSSSSGPSIQLQ